MTEANPAPSVLLVEDDSRLRQLLVRYLEDQGLPVKAVADAAGMWTALDRGHADLLLLDLGLPDADGLDVCRQLRAQGHALPILMVTARGDEVDKIVGLELGADDYLAKPVVPRELLARIRAVWRRTQTQVPGAPLPMGGVVKVGEHDLDLGSRVLTHRASGQATVLTGALFAVLAALVRHPGQPLSRDRLTSLSQGRAAGVDERGIDVAVGRLRKVLETDPHRPRWLQTVRGAGYVFVPGDEG